MKLIGTIVAVSALSFAAQTMDLDVALYTTTPEGPGERVGDVKIQDTKDGASFTVQLSGAAPNGTHGFHIHEFGSCDAKEKDGKLVPALAAGGHWDPMRTGRHTGADGDGHLGDLPKLQADADGKIEMTVVAPRISDVEALRGHALMVHAGGDNYSDEPKKLGGGGARMLCGVIN